MTTTGGWSGCLHPVAEEICHRYISTEIWNRAQHRLNPGHSSQQNPDHLGLKTVLWSFYTSDKTPQGHPLMNMANGWGHCFGAKHEAAACDTSIPQLRASSNHGYSVANPLPPNEPGRAAEDNPVWKTQAEFLAPSSSLAQTQMLRPFPEQSSERRSLSFPVSVFLSAFQIHKLL